MPSIAMQSIHPKSGQPIPPTILTIFGATGNLTAQYLLPTLYHMDQTGILPENFRLVCVGRRPFDTESYLDFIIGKSSLLEQLKHSNARKHFLRHLTYVRAEFGDPATFAGLRQLLDDQDQPEHLCRNRLFYFATSPQYFSQIATSLKESGMLSSCPRHGRQTRVLVEKPFGFNLASARALNRLLGKYFTEEQIYRIDHYVGKETVQNLIVVRFANSIFEPLWNRQYVDHVEISVLYDDLVGDRAPSYETAGALRDAVQNHALQILALIAMDEPRELQTELIRSEKAKVLKALKSFGPRDIEGRVIRGQYHGYEKEAGESTDTETFVALKAFVDLPRWRGVPFYIRSGKGLKRKVTEVSIHFKELPKCLFRGCAGNILTFRIQPDESVYLRINNKIPGFGIELHQANLEFGYHKNFSGELPGAYERLLLDFIQGDQRLFIRTDEIEYAWKFVDSVRKFWANVPLHHYDTGSAGPAAADEWIKRDIREWWTN